MYCPKCNNFGACRYVQRRIKQSKVQGKFKRTDSTAKCGKCGWEGEIL